MFWGFCGKRQKGLDRGRNQTSGRSSQRPTRSNGSSHSAQQDFKSSQGVRQDRATRTSGDDSRGNAQEKIKIHRLCNGIIVNDAMLKQLQKEYPNIEWTPKGTSSNGHKTGALPKDSESKRTSTEGHCPICDPYICNCEDHA